MNCRKDPKRLNDILNTSALQPILAKANLIRAFNNTLATHLPEKGAKHYQVINYENSVVVISASNAAWAMQLRYQEESLLSYFQTQLQLPHVLGIKIKILRP